MKMDVSRKVEDLPHIRRLSRKEELRDSTATLFEGALTKRVLPG